MQSPLGHLQAPRGLNGFPLGKIENFPTCDRHRINADGGEAEVWEGVVIRAKSALSIRPHRRALQEGRSLAGKRGTHGFSFAEYKSLVFGNPFLKTPWPARDGQPETPVPPSWSTRNPCPRSLVNQKSPFWPTRNPCPPFLVNQKPLSPFLG